MCIKCNNLKFNVHKFDPTKTKGIRDTWVADVNRRFNQIKREIIQKVKVEDFLEIKKTPNSAFVTNQFVFTSDTDKVNDFMDWLESRTDDILLDADENLLFADRWQDAYIDSGYKKGVTRAIQAQGGKALGELTQQALLAPVHANRVNLLYTRAFQDLKGITNEMSKQISRVLSDGLIKGYGAEKMAANLADRVDKIGRSRARILARTETIRAHAEGTLTQYEELGVEEVIAEVEWTTAGDDRVCPDCEALEGRTFTIEEARGLIPLHPNCRCAWLPVIKSDKKKKK
ncbi:minor capsid protein [Candidatus Pacearchaeota archaeon]|nr:minor capsid protein [Candidatus Pacearchaeota archaeon]